MRQASAGYANQGEVLSTIPNESIAPLFELVEGQLLAAEPFWRIEPFAWVCNQAAHAPLLAWPALQEKIDALSLTDIESIDSSPAAQAKFFSAYFPQVFALPWLLSAKDVPAQTGFPFWLTNGIGGRKLTQVRDFLARLPQLEGKVVEWCAGKGHLGRLLLAGSAQVPDLEVTSIEWQQPLCDAGLGLAQAHQLRQSFRQLDVLSSAGRAALTEHDHALALHACGDLHVGLLRGARAAHLHSIHVAPCCYHLIAAKAYQPLAMRVSQSALSLTRDELKLAVQGQVTAGQRVANLRRVEGTWRLAYQVLRERYAGAESYRPLASVAKHWFSGSFDAFVGWACDQHGWQLPAAADLTAALAEAELRYLKVKQLDLVRHVFRRPLELWLLLDRALYMQEQGYQVTLEAFCDYQTTPRNVQLHAQKV